MEPIITAILTQLALEIGADFASFLEAFISDFIALRKARGVQALVLPQLVHWWCVAADKQTNADGSLYTKEQRHNYVLYIMEDWAKNLGLDLSASFKDALIKGEMLKRVQAAGDSAVHLLVDEAGKVVQGKVDELIKKQ